MLSALSIRDIVLIRTLDIEFGDGLAVLSGETGAGKSILLDSLSLALGGRGDGGLVRVGAKQGQVTAVFDMPDGHPVFEKLEQEDLLGEAGEPLILRRIQGADGRTRAHVNGRPVSMTTLRSIGRELVEIHGQHEERAMVDPAAHRDLVDAFGALAGDVEAVASAYRAWQRAARELAALRARVAKAAEEADYLRASVDELDTLSPQEGEEEELAARRQTMMNAEKIAGDIDEAYQVLNGQASPVPTLANAMRKLERKADQAPGMLDGAIEAFGQALDALAQVEIELEAAMRQSDYDPHELEATEERLFALRAASRKYNVPVEGLQAHAQSLRTALADLDAGEERIGALDEAAKSARDTLEQLASALAEKRRKAGERLSERVMRELPSLKLEQARFFVEQTIDMDTMTEEGCDWMEFHVQTNPGTRPGALMKVASGGELSRFLLALKVALADRGSAPTLVFDEIDTGAGGAVADAIGARLGQLSAHVQVLCVTHAPQVAARASAHFLIAKGGEGQEQVETRVERIDGPERVEEIARMLSGAQVTSEARAAAERLLDAA